MNGRRPLRIKVNILLITGVLALAVLPASWEAFSSAGILIGGGFSFAYFLLLNIAISNTFAGAGEQDLEPRLAGRLSIKLMFYNLGLALLTVAVILGNFCHPIAFLIGFSAMLFSIGFEALAYAAFREKERC